MEDNARLSQDVARLTITVQSIAKLSEFKPIQVKWRIAGIAAKLRDGSRRINSPKFDVFLNGNQKLFKEARIDGNKLALYVYKDVALSAEKSTQYISEMSFTVNKPSCFSPTLPDIKVTFTNPALISPPQWGRGWYPFLADMTPYIDKDGINVTLDLKLNNEQQILL